ncbi:MAG: hypothetical protein CM15mP115_24010 [Alphaproteobacteria bacterium]|nr:MAG: hypothetical protein CM15mP115_24010 [Alphaproteobacteria bacterium]
MAPIVSSEQISEFREQGVTVLRGVFFDWVDVLRKGVDANMADPDPNARIYTGRTAAAAFCRLLQLGSASPNTRSLFSTPTLPPSARN